MLRGRSTDFFHHKLRVSDPVLFPTGLVQQRECPGKLYDWMGMQLDILIGFSLRVKHTVVKLAEIDRRQLPLRIRCVDRTIKHHAAVLLSFTLARSIIKNKRSIALVSTMPYLSAHINEASLATRSMIKR